MSSRKPVELAVTDDHDIVREGKFVLATHMNTLDMEGWVARLERMSGERCGWGNIGGYAYVWTLGDVDKVRAVADRLHGDLDELHRRQSRRENPGGPQRHRGRAPWTYELAGD